MYNLALPSSPVDLDSSSHHIPEYVQGTAIPQMDEDSGNSLDSPFLLKELLEAITNSPSGKSRSPDGFTFKFYKTKEYITPFMLRVFNSISATNGFPSQTLEAHITLLPKLEKDLRLCSSYRLISLIGVDVTIYAELIVLCLQPLILSLVHTDQVGFVQGREARNNMLKSLLLIDYAQLAKRPACLLSVDAEKAFDRVRWHFLEQTLGQYEFKCFGALSNFKVNLSKSEILNVSLLPHQVQALGEKFLI